MNTKTMRLPPRRVVTPSASINTNKRKEREEGFDRPKPSSTTPITTTKLPKPDKVRSGLEAPSSSIKGSEPSSSNQILLAGYLAHEFLTRGTLFGQPWDPARAAEGPAASPSESGKKKGKPSKTEEADPASKRAEQRPEKYERYVEVADLLRADGTHLPGIFNPTHLARFLQL